MTETIPTGPTRVKRQPRIEGDLAYIPLTKGHEAVIDAADLPLVEGRLWHVTICPSSIYAVNSDRGARSGRVFLHRLIMAPPDGMMVDHINGDSLDCRRSNMRLATRAQNNMNSRRRVGIAGLRGVRVMGRRFQAQINVAGKKLSLGTFNTPEEAHAAYREAASRYHGEFANHG
jgi:hypothetical protein